MNDDSSRTHDADQAPPGSRLPVDPAYWDDLAARSVARALATMEARAGREVPRREARRVSPRSGAGGRLRPWWDPLAERSFGLALTAAAALLGGVLLLEDRPGAALPAPGAATASEQITAALAPEDPMLRALLTQPEEPPAEAWILLTSIREERP